MKKLLIYWPESKLAPTGGPSGYLYNLRAGLEEYSSSDLIIDFYNNAPVRLEDNSRLKSIIPKRILDFRRAINDTHMLKKRFPVDESLYDYDMMHFHWTEEMYLCRDFLKDYRGKVILTSHSPCVMCKEKIGRLRPSDYAMFKKQIDKIEEMDIYAFERADYLIFPCEQAEEPYYHTWDKYREIRTKKKCFYLPTGIMGCEAMISKKEIRHRYGIPNGAFVVSYVGRHNEIKGYKDLKVIGEKILDKYPNIYFLIAGKEEPIPRLDNARWIEVGWTNDPHSIIAASDIFILPNKETYFDLVLLEVMSLGVPVILSETGGNKYFKNYMSTGIKFYSSIEEALGCIIDYTQMNDLEMNEAGKSVKEIFGTDFTVEQFTKRYLQIIEKIATDDYEE